VLISSDDLPYLTADIQLLFKSNSPRAKDDDDARRVSALLADQQRLWLQAH
jgi:hypothetical protein